MNRLMPAFNTDGVAVAGDGTELKAEVKEQSEEEKREEKQIKVKAEKKRLLDLLHTADRKYRAAALKEERKRALMIARAEAAEKKAKLAAEEAEKKARAAAEAAEKKARQEAEAAEKKRIQDAEREKALDAAKTERARRAAKVLFKAIDILYDLSQNNCPYVNSENSKGMVIEEDVSYDDSHEVCKLDTYGMPSDKKRPVMIVIHGGGFTAGGKEYRRGLSKFFAVNGFFTVTPNYGLAPDYAYPEPLLHLVRAANWVKANARKYNLDMKRVVITGDSAGAYYAAMLAAFNGNEELPKVFGGEKPAYKFAGTVLDCGLYDMDTVMKSKVFMNMDDAIFRSFIGTGLEHFDKYEYRDYCEPVRHITPAFPPTYVMYSDKDLFCVNQGPSLIKKLEEVGVYYEYYASLKATSNHCFPLQWRGEDAAAANQIMLSFLDRLIRDRIKFKKPQAKPVNNASPAPNQETPTAEPQPQ